VRKIKKNKFFEPVSKLLILASFASILLAFWGFAYSDIVLASTQWLLVSLVLAVFALYARIEMR